MLLEKGKQFTASKKHMKLFREWFAVSIMRLDDIMISNTPHSNNETNKHATIQDPSSMPRTTTSRRTNKRFRAFHDRVSAKRDLKQTIHRIVRHDNFCDATPAVEQRIKLVPQEGCSNSLRLKLDELSL